MRFKKLLVENTTHKMVEKVKKDCSPFIKKNKNKLERGHFLMRGTDKTYNDKKIISKNSRKRKEVKGNKFKTWIYEYFKPEDYPSREDMIPSQFKRLEGTWATKNNFTVFPVGTNYKLQYTSNVTDFNSFNPYIENHFNPVALLHQALSDGEISEKLEKEGKDALDDYMNKISNEYDDVRVAFNEVWQVISKMAPQDEGLKEGLDRLKNDIKRYFQETTLTQKLPESDEALEVNIYAPQGWYYVKPRIASKEIS